MNILLVVESKHLGNTLKIAKAMEEVAPVTIVDTEKAKEFNFCDYDIIGFGSGIYYSKHEAKLLDFANELSDEKAYTFVFSTSGSGSFDKNNKTLCEILTKKNKKILGTFGCKAFDKFSIFKLVGGLNKGHPDENDFKNAQEFILDIINKYESADK